MQLPYSVRPGTTWAQTPLLFHNVSCRFEPAAAVTETGLAETLASRGMAVRDFFNSGHMDPVRNSPAGSPSLSLDISKGDSKTPIHWPGCAVTELAMPAVGGLFAITEGKGITPGQKGGQP